MQQFAIQIGPVGLRDFEVPDAVQFGGQQRVFVHRLYGGARIVEALGAEPSTISFQGAFTGADAAARFREIDYLRIAGKPVWLSWGSFRYAVIVQTVLGHYCSPWWIQFRIGCIAATVLPGQNGSLTRLAVLLTSDLQNAVAAAVLPGISIAALQSALIPQNALISGTTAQANASNVLTGTLTGVDQGIVTSGSGLVLPPITSITTPSMAATGFLGCVAASANLAGLAATRGYLTRMAKNLTGTLV